MYIPEPVVFWKFFDVISLTFIFVMILVLMSLHYKKNKSLQKTISETLALDRASSTTFSIVMTLFFPLYYAFLWFWVGYLIKAPLVYFVILIFSVICEVVFVWVPARGKGLSRRVHQLTTTLVALAMIALPITLLITVPTLNNMNHITMYGFLAFTILLILMSPTQFFKKHMIYFEITFCLLFLIMMSVIGHS